MSALPESFLGIEPAELFERCVEHEIPLMVFIPSSAAGADQSMYSALAAAYHETFSGTDPFPELAANEQMALVAGIADNSVAVRLGAYLAELLNHDRQPVGDTNGLANKSPVTVGVTVGLPQDAREFDRYQHLAARAALAATRGATPSHAVGYRGPLVRYRGAGILAATLNELESGCGCDIAAISDNAPTDNGGAMGQKRRWKLPRPEVALCIADLRQRWQMFEKQGRAFGLISLCLDGICDVSNTPKNAALIAHVLNTTSEFLTRRQHRVGSASYYLGHGEYALLVPGLDPEEADVMASMLHRDLLDKLIEQLPQESPLSIALGLGVTTATQDKLSDSLAQLAQECDLYRAVNTIDVCEGVDSQPVLAIRSGGTPPELVAVPNNPAHRKEYRALPDTETT